MEFTKGDTVYSSQGQEAEFIARDREDYIVREILEGDEGPHYGDIITWYKCFSIPPKARYEQKTKESEEAYVKAHERLTSLQTEMYAAEKAHKERMAKFAKIKPLEYLEDFIDGKITHYFVRTWCRAEVIEVEKAISTESKWDHKLRLLILRPSLLKNGVQWQLSEYSDGSGRGDDVTPCRSKEEAMSLLRTWIDDMYKKWRSGDSSNLSEARDAAIRHGIPVPADVDAHARKAIENTLSQAVIKAENELQTAKERLKATQPVSSPGS